MADLMPYFYMWRRLQSLCDNPKSTRSCSARLQAGTLESSRCPPEGGRYIIQNRVLTQALQPVGFHEILAGVHGLGALAETRRLNRLRKKSFWQKVRKINRTQLPQDARSFSGDDFAPPKLLPIPPKRDFFRSLFSPRWFAFAISNARRLKPAPLEACNSWPCGIKPLSSRERNENDEE